MVTLALSLRSTVTYATPHNYYLPPFGPFNRFEVKRGHPELLGRLDALLSPCEHHCAYLRRWSPVPLVTRPLYAADYHYFHADVVADSNAKVGGDAKVAGGGDGAIDVSDCDAAAARALRRCS